MTRLDLFGLSDAGLDRDLQLASLSIPTRLLKGGTDPINDNAPCLAAVPFPAPAPYPPLSSSSHAIGLVGACLNLRQNASELGLVEDDAHAQGRPASFGPVRARVPAATGRIAGPSGSGVVSKKALRAVTEPAAAVSEVVPKKKRKKQVALEQEQAA